MKIIGWLSKGNVVTFMLGKDDLNYWSGDDWNDAPYEHNACTYPMFGIEECVTIAFAMNKSVQLAADDREFRGNTPFSMNCFKERKIPIMFITDDDYDGPYTCYKKCLDMHKGTPIYMGDRFEDINFESLGASVVSKEWVL